MIKYFQLFILTCTLSLSNAQEKIPKILHEFDLGGTGQLHTDGTGLHYYNIFDEAYVLGGRKRGSFITLFVPKFAFNYSRHIDNKVFSFGYLYYVNVSDNAKYYRIIHYVGLNLGVQLKNMIKSEIFVLRPKIALQLNYSQDIKIDFFNNYLYDHNSLKNLTPALGLGFINKIYIFNKVYLANEFLYVLHHKPESFFFQHNINLGYRF
jgi:hypothetical protein